MGVGAIMGFGHSDASLLIRDPGVDHCQIVDLDVEDAEQINVVFVQLFTPKKSTCNIARLTSDITDTFMHTRTRHIQDVLLKRSKIFPVLSVLGPRQVGKSTFLMKQWAKQKNAVYITFDNRATMLRAQRSPEQLLIDESSDQQQHLIIDEAHKVPHLFDSIKSLVDADRHVGAFTLSGSVEFSVKSGVRESLAGRMGITRLYPMTLRELDNNPFESPWVKLNQNFDPKVPLKPKIVETWLERGGMPIFCSLSDIDERMGIIHSWLDAICHRDLKQLKDAEYDSELAYNILMTLAVNSDVSLLQLTSEFGFTNAAIKKHLAALESLFLIYKIPSIENPRSHFRYHLFDAGVLNALLGGQQNLFSRHASLLILVMNEILAQYEYAGKLKPSLMYYRTRGGAEIDLVLKTKDKLIGIECTTSVDIPAYKRRGMKSFLRKFNKAVGYFIAPVQKSFKLDQNIFVIPWNSLG